MTSDAISIVIADDHPLFRKGLTDVLGADPSFRIVGEAADGDAALALVRRHAPAIALLDIEMPKGDGLTVAGMIHREALTTAVVLLTMYRDAAILRRALDVGVRGYVLKDGAVAEIAACLHMVASGRAYVSAALSGDLIARRADAETPEMVLVAELTDAEQRVLQLIAQGLTTAEIAATLGNSPKTIENHRSHICRKLGLTGPQALLRFALERKGLLA